MPTAHIESKKGDIAKTVLMSGDPKRCEFIANTYLENVRVINTVRNMTGFTGTYKGKEVSVIPSGMGCPSIGIYSYELYGEYDVDRIVRVGSCGSYRKEINIYDVIVVDKAYTDSNFGLIQNGYDKNYNFASPELVKKMLKYNVQNEHKLFKGSIFSSDVFYKEDADSYKKLVTDYNVLGVEMEAFALFHNASVFGKEAGCIVTVSDSLVKKEYTSSEEREKAFTTMMEIALKAVTE